MQDAICTGVHWPVAAVVRLLATLVACKGDEPLPTVPHPQITGESVNIVSCTKWLDGTPFLQRQNEPSLAVSSVNSEHLLAGANDYRTVNAPFPCDADDPTIEETGDAWLGLFQSLDGG